MDYALLEINQHKINISNLSNQLINTFEINQEIFINNEIKKETEILYSLLFKKKNAIMNPMFQNINNNNNFFVPNCDINNMNNNLLQMNQQQLMYENKTQLINNEKGNKEKYINIVFQRRNKYFPETCEINEMFSTVAQRFKNKIGENENLEFIYNAVKINENLKINELGLRNNDKILVNSINDIVG